MSLFLSCEQTNALLSDYADGLLGPWDRFRMKLHLLFCPDCRAILATLRALPYLLADLEETPPEAAQAALEAAMARIGQPAARPWPATPVPEDVWDRLEPAPDRPLAILAAAHRELALARGPLPGPYHLPPAILAQLPPESQWRWAETPSGLRRAELLAEPAAGPRLVLEYAPPHARIRSHRHLGSESCLVLAGSLRDAGGVASAGDWLHHGPGSVHGPVAEDEACWCLIREEGSTEAIGRLEWLRNLGAAG